jgi:hypothetical protein
MTAQTSLTRPASFVRRSDLTPRHHPEKNVNWFPESEELPARLGIVRNMTSAENTSF